MGTHSAAIVSQHLRGLCAHLHCILVGGLGMCGANPLIADSVCAAGHGRIELPKASQGRCWQTVPAPFRSACRRRLVMPATAPCTPWAPLLLATSFWARSLVPSMCLVVSPEWARHLLSLRLRCVRALHSVVLLVVLVVAPVSASSLHVPSLLPGMCWPVCAWSIRCIRNLLRGIIGFLMHLWAP